MVSTVTVVAGIGAVTAYLAGTILQFRSFYHNTQLGLPILLLLAGTGLVLHGYANLHVIITDQGLNLGIFTSASLVAWIMLLFLLPACLRLEAQDLLMLVQPLCVVGLLAELLWAANSSTIVPLGSFDTPLLWHIFLSIAAYSILLMAACQSVLVGYLENRLRARRDIQLLRMLPPLQTMEALLFNLLWAGLATLTLAIASGFAFLDDMFAQRVAHHTILSIASWCIYSILLVGHKILGWRGTTAVRWTLIAFTLLVLGYFGSKFVIEVLLS